MSPSNRILALFALSIAACEAASAAPAASTTPTSAADPAMTRERASAALTGIAEDGADCRTIALKGAPIGVAHLGNAQLQQSAGRASLVSFGSTPSKAATMDGVVVATITGKRPSGELLGDHHVLFAEGTLRTHDDVLTVSPGAQPCTLNVSAKIHVVDGSGEFAGLHGDGVAEAQLDTCGRAGRATIYARLCKAK